MQDDAARTGIVLQRSSARRSTARCVAGLSTSSTAVSGSVLFHVGRHWITHASAEHLAQDVKKAKVEDVGWDHFRWPNAYFDRARAVFLEQPMLGLSIRFAVKTANWRAVMREIRTSRFGGRGDRHQSVPPTPIGTLWLKTRLRTCSPSMTQRRAVPHAA